MRDITYLKARGRFCYLATVMCVLPENPRSCAGARPLREPRDPGGQQAIRSRPDREDLLFHSDRGIETAAYRYKALWAISGIRSSISAGHPEDIHMESLRDHP